MKLKTYSYKKVISTNKTAINKIKSGINKGIIVSDQQTNGRGSHGKKWISYKGNLFTTFFFNINEKKNVNEMLKFNCNIVKMTLRKFIKKKINIKYPNDLIINNEKICGILQEILRIKNMKYMIVGIGINIDQSPNFQNYKTTHVNQHLKNKISKKKDFNILKNIYEKKLKNL